MFLILTAHQPDLHVSVPESVSYLNSVYVIYVTAHPPHHQASPSHVYDAQHTYNAHGRPYHWSESPRVGTGQC